MSIEKLLASQPGTVLPDNISSAGNASDLEYWSMRCPKCRGRKRVKVAPKTWEPCPRCGGSGKRPERSAEATTRAAFAGLTPAEIAGYVSKAKLSRVEWHMVQAYLFNNENVIPGLFKEVYAEVLLEQKPETDELKELYFDLSRLSVLHAIYPHRLRYENRFPMLLEISRTTWYKRYKPRYRPVREVPAQWLTHGLYGLASVLR